MFLLPPGIRLRGCDQDRRAQMEDRELYPDPGGRGEREIEPGETTESGARRAIRVLSGPARRRMTPQTARHPPARDRAHIGPPPVFKVGS